MKNKSEFLNLVESYLQVYKKQINEQSINPNQFQAPTSTGANANQFNSAAAPFTGTTNNSSAQQSTNAALPQQQGVSNTDKLVGNLFRAQYSKFKELANIKDPNAFVDAVRKMFPNEPNIVKQVDDMVKSEPGNLQNIINGINKMVGAEKTIEAQSSVQPFSQGTIE